MSVDIPSKFELELGLGLDISGIPTNYGIGITQLPTIDIKLQPINIALAPVEIKPIDMSFRLKEIPWARFHFPVDYRVAFGLCGVELACIHLCGQSQIITEPYVPNPCECRGAIAPG
jgi:hypothetical protein